MKSVCFVKVISGCLIAVGTIVPPAFSFPFAPTSDGFAAFLNSRKWEDGKNGPFLVCGNAKSGPHIGMDVFMDT